ncbi:hypothetical protein [Paracoccus mutanolyticus]|uniref:hypothetical protein n=1 Tax=Paracoccus mutanolyticus TaxID=1499308 RepID=UPI00167AAC34|nr:hypothetical protein [Paracoccus mutanolyticus]
MAEIYDAGIRGTDGFGGDYPPCGLRCCSKLRRDKGVTGASKEREGRFESSGSDAGSKP